MRKNGSRQISVKQYRFTDLFLFAVILLAAELLAHFAIKWFPDEAIYTFSFMVPIVLLVAVRWGWPSVFYPALSGLVICLFNVGSADGVQWACYLIGNSFIALMLIPRYLIGVERIASKWWATALFALGGWLCVYLGRSVVWAVGVAVSPAEGIGAADGFISFALYDILSPAMAVIILLVMRKLDGMFEDQMSYLERRYGERKEKMRPDEFGDELEEIDEEALEILGKENDLYDR